MQRDVKETRQTLRPYFGHAGNWLRIERAVAHDAQLPTALRDEHLSARQPDETPGVREPSRVHHDADLLFSSLVRERSCAERRHHDPVRPRSSAARCRRPLLLLLSGRP
jgi:hypothetical protein